MTAASCDDPRHAADRFCATCGAWRDAGQARAGGVRGRRPRLGALGAGCLGVVVIALGGWASVGMLAVTDDRAPIDPRDGSPPGEVALPDEVAETDATPGAEDGRDRRHVRDTGAESAGMAHCVPRGCVRWERHVTGLLAADDDAVHVVDERQVRSYDALDGTLRWRRSLTDPLPAGAAPDGFATYPPPVAIDARRGTVVTASAHRVINLDVAGTWRWTTAPRHGGAIELVALVADGHVVTVTRADDSLREPVRIAVLDTDSGVERWGQSITAVLAVDDEQITVLDASGAIAGLDAIDGRRRWRRDATSAVSTWPPLPGGRDTATAPADGNGETNGAGPDDADRRQAARAARARFDALIVGFPGGSATIRGADPDVLLEEPTVVVVDDWLLGIGRDSDRGARDDRGSDRRSRSDGDGGDDDQGDGAG